MTSKSQNYAFITPDESEEDTENLSEEIIRSKIRRNFMLRLFNSTILILGFFGCHHRIRGISKLKM